MTKLVSETPLDHYQFANAGIIISPMPQMARLSLRAGEKAVKQAEKALGINLPNKPKTTASKASRHALWIGPDEWLILDEAKAMKAGDLTGVSQVDVSHRNVAFSIKGANVKSVLNAGCPQDLSLEAFPVGACSRTVYGKAEVILWRKAEDHFQLECWRSFSPYVGEYLQKAGQSALF